MSRDPALIAYVLLTLLVLWALADRLAPYHGRAAACSIGYVYDGDTVELICGASRSTARLVGFDTPETKEPRCPAEAALGRKATERLRALLRSGDLQVFAKGHDKFGRELITVTLDGRNIGDLLVAEGLAHAYHGGSRGGWCD